MENELDEMFLETGKSMEANVSFDKPLEINEIKMGKHHFKRRFLVAAIICTMLLSIAAYAASPLGFDLFQNAFGALGLHIAEEQGTISSSLGSATCKNITMEVTSAVAGYNTIIISCKYYGVEGTGYKNLVDFSNSDGLKLINSSDNIMRPRNNYQILLNSFKEDTDDNYIECYEIDGSIKEKQILKLVVSNVGDVIGNWTVEFELEPSQTYIYNIEKDYTVDEGIIYVKRIIIDAFSTSIEYDFKQFDEYWDYTAEFLSNKEYEWTSFGSYSESVQHFNERDDGTWDGTWDYLVQTIRPFPHDSTVITMKYRKMLEWDNYKEINIKLKEEDRIIE